MQPIVRGGILFVVVSGFLFFNTISLRSADVVSTFLPGSGLWSVNANWSNAPALGGFPNNGNAGVATYDALIGNDTVRLDQNITIQKLVLDGGLITSNFNLTANDTITWTGGTIDGVGILTANAGVVFGGSAQKILASGRTLNNAGSSLWTNGLIRFFTGALLNNSGNFTANSAGQLDFDHAFGGTNIVNNPGIYIKTGTGTNNSNVTFNNHGTVEVQAGRLELGGGGDSSGLFFGPGTLDFGSGIHVLSSNATVTVAQVVFSDGTVTNNGRYDVSVSTLGVGGTVRFTPTSSVGSVGLVTLSGGALDFNSGDPINTASLNLSGGVLGGSDPVTVSGMTLWTGGTMQGSGTTDANGGILLGGTEQKILQNGRVLNNPGAATWTNGLFRFFTGGTFNNSGSFTAASAGALTINPAFGGVATFNNPGNYIKGGSGVNTIDVPFHNSGVIDVQGGAVLLGAGGNSSGRFMGPGTLNFNGGTHVLSGSSTVVVAQVVFSVGTVTNSGRYDVSGSTLGSGGIARFVPASSVGSVGVLTVSAGTLDFSSGDPIVTTSLDLNGGFLAGTDTVTISGLTLWTGGTMQGTGTTHANGGILMGGTETKVLEDGRVLNNPTSATWTNGLFRFFSGGTFNNPGTFTAASAGNLLINPAFGGVANLNNSGSYIKAGTGTNTIDVPFHNSGLAEVQAGRLSLNGGGNSSGRFIGPGTLEFGGGTHVLSGLSTVVVSRVVFDGATVTNQGRYDVPVSTTMLGGTARFTPASSVESVGLLTINSGTLDFSSGEPIESASLDLSGGFLAGTDSVTISGFTLWTGGTMQGTGITHANGGMLLGGTEQKILEDGRILNNSGGATWTNGLFRFFMGGTFNNLSNFTASSSGNLLMDPAFGGVATFNNPSTYTKSGTGTNTVDVTFNNTGIVEVQAGRLELSGGGNSSGRFMGPGTLEFGGGTHVLSTSSTVTVAQVIFSNGTTTNNGRYDVTGSTTVSGGVARFSAASTVDSVGPLTVSSGTLDFSSGEPIESTSLNLSGGTLEGTDFVTISGLTVWSDGTMEHSGTTHAQGGLLLIGANQKVLQNGRTLNNTGSATWTNGLLRFFTGGTLNNQGTFTVQTAGELRMDQAFGGTNNFNNAGVYIKTGSGTNNIITPFNNTGTVLAQQGELELDDYRQSGGSTVLTGGVIRAISPLGFSGGTLTGSGLVIGSVTNNATVAPGFGAGAGSLHIGTLTCLSNSVLRIELGGLNQSTEYDFIHLTNAVALGGTLEVKFINGFQTIVSSNSVFTIVAAGNSLSGGFANVASGQRVFTTDGFGSFRATYSAATKTVVLSEFEPILSVVANFAGNPTNGPAPLNVTFVNLTAGSATNFAWNFGDGETSTQPNPTHLYTNAGTYTVSLTASGPGGTNSVTKTNYISVQASICSLVVLNTTDNGPGSLRAAIECANSLPGVDTITFAIPGAVLHTITPVTPLPEITDPVILDGYSQAGSSVNILTNGNNAVLRVELNGSNVSQGLHVSGGASVVRGLVLNRLAIGGAAIRLSGQGGNVVAGNFIGTDATGTGAAANGGSGVSIQSSGNVVGGTEVAARNIIAFNAGQGVRVEPSGGSAATNNAVLGNFIFGNGDLGIDLVAGGVSGVTTNDNNDADDGPNHLQNFPILTSVTNFGGFTTIAGTHNSAPSSVFRLEFFSNVACHPNGHGEGRAFLGATNVTTDAGGNAAFSITFPSLGGTAFTAIATDSQNNSSEFSACVSPITGCDLICPANIVVSSQVGACGATVNYPAPTRVGDCGDVVSLPPSGSLFPVGITTVNCSTTNGASCSFLVTVLDEQAPSITCSTNLTLTTTPGSCFRSNVIYTIGFTDNCPGAQLVQTAGLPSGGAYPKGTTTNSFVVTDASGNMASCSFLVTIVDAEPPQLTCPANIVRTTDPGQCSASNVTFAATFGDNCAGASVVYTPASGSAFPKGTSTVICVATDAAGNTNSCTFTVTINDEQAPLLACPFEITVSTAPGQCSATNVAYTATASDNCPGLSVLFDPPSGSTFPKGTNLVSCLALDVSGNSNSCVFRVIVLDGQAPIISCPNPIVITAGLDETNVVVNYSVTAIDNCAGVAVQSTPASGSLFPLGTTQVNATATDASGNTNSCSFIVAVLTPEAPQAELSLVKLAAPSSVAIGGQISYSLLVSNAGPDLAANVTLIDTLPTVVSFVSAESDFGTCSEVDNNVVCELGSLAEGDTATVTITVLAEAAGTICNFASVQSQQIDLVLSNNTASICTLVTNSPSGADLSVTKIDSLDPITVGSNLTYSIRVRNNGPQAASGVILTDLLPPGLAIVSLPTNSTIAGDTVTCNIGNLAPGASVTRTIVVIPGSPGQICNSASITANQMDPVTGNNSDMICTDVRQTQGHVHDLAVVKITAPPSVVLTDKQPSRTRFVTVQIQNRSPHNEVISSLTGFGTNLVTLRVESLGICPDLVPTLRVGPPQKQLPVTLKPKQKLNVIFDVTFTTNCISDAGKSSKKTPGHEDYRYFAMVHHQAIDGEMDTHPEDDFGPRSANPPFEVDPNPDGTIKDKGVGKLKPNKTFGADIVTDVVKR